MEIPITFMAWLQLLGSPLFVGIVISVLLVKWSWFVNLASTVKFWIVGLLSLGLPILSQVLILYLPPSFAQFMEFWWPTIVAGLAIWTSSQVWNQMFGIDGAIRKATNLMK